MCRLRSTGIRSASLSHHTFIFVELLNVQKRVTDSCSLIWVFLGESRTSIVGAEKEFRLITVVHSRIMLFCINIPFCISLSLPSYSYCGGASKLTKTTTLILVL